MITAPPGTTAKPDTASRNAACYCGSGKRYKYCCGAFAGSGVEKANDVSPGPAAETIGTTMHRALEVQLRGDLGQAADLYRQVLLVQPENIDALHMLGVIHFFKNELREAEQLIRYANGLCPEPLRNIQHNLKLLREKIAAADGPVEPLRTISIEAAESPITGVEEVCAAQEIALPAVSADSATDPASVCSTSDQKSFFPSLKTFMLHDAVVDAESAIPATRTLALLDSHVDLARHESPEWRYGLYRRGAAADAAARYMGADDYKQPRLPAAIVMTSSYWANWAHFLTEVLPKALIADQRAQWRDWPMLISGAGLHNAHELLRLLLPPERRIIKANGRILIDHAGYVSSVGFCPVEYVYDRKTSYPKIVPTDCIFSPYALDLVRSAAKRLLQIAPSEARLLLYVRRNGASRRFINQDAVEQAFAARGFQIVVPESLPIREQIGLFSRAKVIAGPTGAGIANLVFAPRGCQILVLAAANRHAPFHYWLNMADAAGHRVQYLFGQAAGSPSHPAHPDLYFDNPSRLGPMIDAAISAAEAS